MKFGICGLVAAILSSAINHSFWWGLLHFCLGPVYIIYWMAMYTDAIAVIKGAW